MNGHDVFEILSQRGVVKLHHANSVRTSISLLKLGGLASRQLVESNGLAQTNQITDEIDRKCGIWNDVFLDAVDIHSRISDRNKYGPVLFELDASFLLDLSPSARVLITRSNPSKWSISTPEEERYFLTPEELRNGLEVGNFDHMLVVRNDEGIVPFGRHLQKIVLDEPKLHNGVSPEFSDAASAIDAAAKAKGFSVPIARRTCSDRCKCYSSYSRPNTRIPWFYNLT